MDGLKDLTRAAACGTVLGMMLSLLGGGEGLRNTFSRFFVPGVATGASP